MATLSAIDLVERMLAPTPSRLGRAPAPRALTTKRCGSELSVQYGDETARVRCPSTPIALAMERGLHAWAERGVPWAIGFRAWPSLAALHAHVDHELECARIVAARRLGRRAA